MNLFFMCLLIILPLTKRYFTFVIKLVAQLVKNPPAMQETPVWFLGREDPLEKGKATHFSIFGLPLWLRND